MLHTVHKDSIKVYAYLLFKFSTVYGGYDFTLRELANMLGYSEKSNDYADKVQDIVVFLEKLSLIHYDLSYEACVDECGKSYTKTRRRLT